jgi:uncharacterized protein
MVPVLGAFGLYLLLALPPLLLGLWAQGKVRSTFDRASRIPSASGWTGAQVARRLLDLNGLSAVAIERVSGLLSDHYDPGPRVLRLSRAVYEGNNLGSVGIAAHEAGHALQDQQGYELLKTRTTIARSIQIGSWLGPVVFLLGIFLPGSSRSLGMTLGLLLFTATALLALVTLPLELDASRRAKKQLVSQRLIAPAELGVVSAMLSAAALTYVAAAVRAIASLVYWGPSRRI